MGNLGSCRVVLPIFGNMPKICFTSTLFVVKEKDGGDDFDIRVEFTTSSSRCFKTNTKRT